MKNSDPNYLTRNQLCSRGWTDAMIRDFLGEPDDETTARFYRFVVAVRLWRAKRVLAVEKSEKWKARIEKANIRREAGKKALQTRIDKVKEKVNQLKIIVKHYDWDTLVQRACDHYNCYHAERSQWRHSEYESWQEATPESDEYFLHRIIVNYLRHECTDYDSWRVWLMKQPGGDEAFALLCQKVYTAIRESNPALAQECERQLEEKLRDCKEECARPISPRMESESGPCDPAYCKHIMCARCGKCFLHCAQSGCGAQMSNQEVA